MWQRPIQQAARKAFAVEDWRFLMTDPFVFQRFSALESIQDVEAFVFDAYDRLRHRRDELRQGHRPTEGPVAA